MSEYASSRGDATSRSMAADTGGPAEQASHGTVTRLAAVAALAGFLFGFDSSVINGAVKSIGDSFKAGSAALGFTVSSALLGAAAGALGGGRIADKLGRVRAMEIAALLFLISAVGSAYAGSLWGLVIFRVIGGVGVGAASVIAPAYIAEIAPASIRGRLGSLQQLAIVLGIAVALISDYVIVEVAGGSAKNQMAFGLSAWRWMFLSMVVPSVVYGALALTLPESPRWLVARGCDEDAKGVLARVVGGDVNAKVAEIRETLNREHKPRFRDLRGRTFGLMPVVWIGIALSVFQQFVGINVIFYYSSVLWQAVGFKESNSLFVTVISGLVNIVGTFVAIALIDRVGRKILLLAGSVGMTIALGALAILFGTAPVKNGQPSLPGITGPAALVAANVFVFMFALSWGPVVWVWLGERFPNRIRAAALGLAASAQWVANWIVSTSFPPLKNIGLGLAYGIYTGFAFLSLLFVMKFVQETKGRELEMMHDEAAEIEGGVAGVDERYGAAPYPDTALEDTRVDDRVDASRSSEGSHRRTP